MVTMTVAELQAHKNGKGSRCTTGIHHGFANYFRPDFPDALTADADNATESA